MSAASARVASARSSAQSVAKLEAEEALFLSSNFTLKEVSKRMLHYDVEAAVVVDARTYVEKGVVTPLDIVRSVAAKGWMSPLLQITKVITANTDVVPMDGEAVAALCKMMTMHLRHLPVVDAEEEVVGVLSMKKCIMDALRRIEASEMPQVNGISTSLGELTLGNILPEETPSFLEEEGSMSSAALAITMAKKAVMVVKEGGGVGVVTPVAIMQAVVEDWEIEVTTVADVMTRSMETLPRANTVMEALEEMRAKNSQHVLVEAGDGGGVARVVSADDIVEALTGSLESERMEAFCKGIMETFAEEKAEGDPEPLEQQVAQVADEVSPLGSVSDSERGWERRLEPVASAEEPVAAVEGPIARSEALSETGSEADTVAGTPLCGAKSVEAREPGSDTAVSSAVSEEVVILSCDRTVTEVAEEMTLKRADAAVLTERGRVVGIITHRELTCRVIALERPPDETAVRDVMTPVPGLMMASVTSAGLDGAREAGTVGEDSSLRLEAGSGSRPEEMEPLPPQGKSTGWYGLRSILSGVGFAALAGLSLLSVMRSRR